MAFEDLFSSIGNIFSGGGETPAPTAGVAAQPKGGFDFSSIMPLLIGGGSMLASKLLGRGDQKRIDQSNKALRDTQKSATGAGQEMVDRARAGKLTDAQQAAVDKLKREQNATMQQRFAQMGIPVSTMQSQAANQIDENALAFSQKLIQESMDQGLRALGLGGTTSTQILSNAMQSKRDLANTIGEVAKQMGQIFNTPEQKPTTPPQTSANAVVPPEWAQALNDISEPEGMGY